MRGYFDRVMDIRVDELKELCRVDGKRERGQTSSCQPGRAHR